MANVTESDPITESDGAAGLLVPVDGGGISYVVPVMLQVAASSPTAARAVALEVVRTGAAALANGAAEAVLVGDPVGSQ